MLREREYILRQINLGLDAAVAVAAVTLAHFSRESLSGFAPEWVRPGELGQYKWLIGGSPLMLIAGLAFFGAYRPEATRESMARSALRIAKASLLGVVLLATMDFFLGPLLRPDWTQRTSGALILLAPAASFPLLMLKTWALRQWLLRRRASGRDHRSVLLVGSGTPLEQFAAMIRDHPLWGMQIAGVVTDRPEWQGDAFDPESVPEARQGFKVVADLEGAAALLWREPVDEVVLLPDAAPLGAFRPLFESCEEMGIRMHLPLNFFHAAIAHPVVGTFDGMPVVSYWPSTPIGPAIFLKYAFDRVAATLMILLMAPPMAIIALAIKLTSGRGEPVLFGQKRCGLNGRVFTMWKFRTMHGDAETQRAALERFNQMDGPVFKMREDPRVTALGKWLRRFSIDETPQLWNVMTGEMSLVGPRPPLPAEVEKYDRWQRRRLSMKPGMTCLWQVSGRNKVGFEAWMKMDLEYIDEWSLFLDFKILCRTFVAVLTGAGAV